MDIIIINAYNRKSFRFGSHFPLRVRAQPEPFGQFKIDRWKNVIGFASTKHP